MRRRNRIDIGEQRERLIDKLTRSADRSFDRFADDLGDVLRQYWHAASVVAASKVSRFLRNSTKAFTPAVAARIDKMMKTTLSGDMSRVIRPIIRAASVLSYTIGVSDMGVIASFSLPDRRAIKWLENHTMFWSLNHYDSHVSTRLKKLTTKVIEQGLSRHDAGLFFRNTIGEDLSRSDSYWRLTADAIATRGRSYGTISAMESAGVLEYEIDAVLDHRTSTICEYLNGKRFKVADAAQIRDLMIQATTPEQAKNISPWLSPKIVVGESPERLARMGVVVPPFHGNCRSRIVIVR